MIQKKRNNRRKNGKFQPNRAYIAAAFNEYMANGGTITKLKADERSFNFFIEVNDPVEVDDFLGGGWV